MTGSTDTWCADKSWRYLLCIYIQTPSVYNGGLHVCDVLCCDFTAKNMYKYILVGNCVIHIFLLLLTLQVQLHLQLMSRRSAAVSVSTAVCGTPEDQGQRDRTCFLSQAQFVYTVFMNFHVFSFFKQRKMQLSFFSVCSSQVDPA